MLLMLHLLISKLETAMLPKLYLSIIQLKQSLKVATPEQYRGNRPIIRGFEVDVTSNIKDARTFVGSTSTKDSLTLYLA